MVFDGKFGRRTEQVIRLVEEAGGICWAYGVRCEVICRSTVAMWWSRRLEGRAWRIHIMRRNTEGRVCCHDVNFDRYRPGRTTGALPQNRTVALLTRWIATKRKKLMD